MRLLVQRVKKAEVKVDEIKVGSIEEGLFVLVGIKKNDTTEDAEKLANKLSKLRLMADDNGKMNLSLLDTQKKVLVVSQFTLYSDASGGNRPSFINAALPEDAKKIYEHFVATLKQLGLGVETGNFGEYMKIDTLLDGPVTILLE